MRGKRAPASLALLAMLAGCAAPAQDDAEPRRTPTSATSGEQGADEVARRKAAREDEAEFRPKAEALARRMGVAVPTWQETWKARYKSLQYQERKVAAERREEEEREARERHAAELDRRRRARAEFWEVMDDWRDRVERAENENWREEFKQKYVRLTDFAAAGIENDDRKLLKVQILRLAREELERDLRNTVPRHVYLGLFDLQVERRQHRGDFEYADLPTGPALARIVRNLQTEGETLKKKNEAEWEKHGKEALERLAAQLDNPPTWNELRRKWSEIAKGKREQRVDEVSKR